jgi:hypothetical protein
VLVARGVGQQVDGVEGVGKEALVPQQRHEVPPLDLRVVPRHPHLRLGCRSCRDKEKQKQNASRQEEQKKTNTSSISQ